MARWFTQVVTLTANQASGIDPILATEPGVSGVRRLLYMASRSAAATELFLATGGVTGEGIPVAIGERVSFDASRPGFDGALYIKGATAGEKVVFWLC